MSVLAVTRITTPGVDWLAVAPVAMVLRTRLPEPSVVALSWLSPEAPYLAFTWLTIAL